MMLTLYLGILIAFACLVLYRLYTSKAAFDRVLYLNLFSTLIIMFILVFSISSELFYLLDVVLIYSLLGFISIVFLVRFIIRREGK